MNLIITSTSLTLNVYKLSVIHSSIALIID